MIRVKIRGIEETLRHVDAKQRSLASKTRTFLSRLADIGVETAAIKFAFAQYDGTNDVQVNEPEWVADNRLRISATGNAVGFIEFGTGVHYVEVHPLADAFGAVRGGYGQGKGRHDTWGYYGDPGTNGIVVEKKDGRYVTLTHGNPPARAMYDAAKAMRERILTIAREVYGGD